MAIMSRGPSPAQGHAGHAQGHAGLAPSRPRRVLADVEGARDVAVGHAPRELHLLPEARDDARVVQQVAPQHLERDHLVELDVADAVDAPHPAGAEQPEHL
jgi:hypothetical protein